LVKGQFQVEVAGVTYPNDDGSERQAIIRSCHEGEKLILKHTPIPEDKNGVIILRQNGQQLGWLPRWNAQEIAPYLDRGEIVTATLDEIKEYKKRPLNCSIIITKPEAKKVIESRKKGCLIKAAIAGGIFLLIVILIVVSC